MKSTLKRVPTPVVKLRTLYDVPLEKAALEHGVVPRPFLTVKRQEVALIALIQPSTWASTCAGTSTPQEGQVWVDTHELNGRAHSQPAAPATVCQQLQIGTAIRNWPWAVWYVGEAGDKHWNVSGAGDKLSLVYQVIRWYLNLSLYCNCAKQCKSTWWI